MNAIKVLQNDHHQIKVLFKQYAAAPDVDHKKDVGQRLVAELTIHTSLEEQFVYRPAQALNKGLMQQALEGLEKHRLIRTACLDLDALVNVPATHEREARMDAIVKVLAAEVGAHLREEELLLFPLLCEAMTGAELESIGSLLLRQRMVAPRRPEPDPVGGPLSRTIDRVFAIARDLLTISGSQPSH
jgi:hypothetical protein